MNKILKAERFCVFEVVIKLNSRSMNKEEGDYVLERLYRSQQKNLDKEKLMVRAEIKRDGTDEDEYDLETRFKKDTETYNTNKAIRDKFKHLMNKNMCFEYF